MEWSQALAAVRLRRVAGRRITGVTEDTRRLAPGMVFVARQGLRMDGHELLAMAREQGAILTVGARRVGDDLPDVMVPDPAAALAHLVSAWYGDPGRHLTLIGITGTNGKTTAAHLTAAVLRAAGHSVGTIGTTGYAFNGQKAVGGHTTPPPEVLYRLLAQWRAAGATHVVMEVSAQALTQRRTAACTFAAAALTSFARDHGEFYPDQHAYREAKVLLFRDLRGVAVLPGPPAGDADLQAFASAASEGAARTVFYGPEGTVRGRSLASPSLDRLRMELRLPEEDHASPVVLPLPGEHNVTNATCAAAIAWSLGVPGEIVRAGLEGASRPAGRALCMRMPDRDAWAVVDYAHNPAALAAVLRWLRGSVRGKVYVVLGARGERDRGKRPLMGAVVAALADSAVFTSDRPAGEAPDAAAAPMLQAAKDCGTRACFIGDRAAAIAHAVGLLRDGDCVLVTGKGTETWQGDSPGRDGTDDPTVLQALGAIPLCDESRGEADADMAAVTPMHAMRRLARAVRRYAVPAGPLRHEVVPDRAHNGDSL